MEFPSRVVWVASSAPAAHSSSWCRGDDEDDDKENIITGTISLAITPIHFVDYF